MKIFVVVLICLINSVSLFSHSEGTVKRSICLVIRSDFRGERELAERIKRACNTLGWEAHQLYASQRVLSQRKYDWILTMVPGKQKLVNQDNYLILFDPEHHYFNSDGYLRGDYSGYTGYLTTYSNIDMLVEDKKIGGKRIYKKQWFPTVQHHSHRKVTPDKLFCFLGHWGDRKKNERYITLYKKLSQKKYTNLYGFETVGRGFGKAYKGAIDYDGESVVRTISEMGVCLVLHSETHLKYGIPSGRIFEATAASAVIISDMNNFITENFGDSVFYVDQTLSGEEMFKQVDKYMTWIKNHPNEALDMARRSHKIFEEKFCLENQLLEFDDFHQSFQK
ncbi:MAG: glycosyltransferase [Chlamydiota bacterium]|nr:glycosyltransferase [Chlamydiota bacterium]